MQNVKYVGIQRESFTDFTWGYGQKPLENEFMIILLLSETHWRPTRLIGDRHTSLETHQTCLINHVCLWWVSDQACWYPIRHVGPRSGKLVSYETCWSPMRHVGLRWGMSVFDEVCWSPIRHLGLRWISDNNNIFVNA